MADSLAKQILDVLAARVAAIGGWAATGTKIRAWHELSAWPVAFVGLAGDDKERGPTRSKEGRAAFFVHVVVKTSTPLESFLAAYKSIEDAVEADPTLGMPAAAGNVGVLDAVVTGCNPLVTSETIADGVHVADVFVEVSYRHPRGAS